MGSTTLQLVAVVVAAALASTAAAFVPSLGASGVISPLGSVTRSSGSSKQRGATLGMKYVPDGLSPEQWKKMQKEEAEKKKKMGDLGQVGHVSFYLSNCFFVNVPCWLLGSAGRGAYMRHGSSDEDSAPQRRRSE